MRQRILVIFLILMMVAFAYDKFVSARQWKTAWDKVNSVGKSDEVTATTNKMIQELLDRTPSETYTPKEHPKMVVERYSWRRGLLVLNNNIYVIYSKAENLTDNSTELYYYSAISGDRPTDENFPKKTIVKSSVPIGEKPEEGDDKIQSTF